MSRIHGDAQIAHVAAAIGDGARARILLTLNDGRALPASVLAAEAGVAPSTASEHLRRLLDAGLVSSQPRRKAATAITGSAAPRSAVSWRRSRNSHPDSR